MDSVMTLTDVEEEILERLQQRIPYNENIFANKINYELVLEDIVLNARYIGLSKRYPFGDKPMELPNKYINWQYRCCIELFNLADKQGFSSYSENGLNWSRLTDGLSTQLIEEIMPKPSIPSKEESEENVGN